MTAALMIPQILLPCSSGMTSCFFLMSDWLDLRFSYRGYSDWVQDALPWLEIHLLHAGETCIQGISAYQSFRSSAPGSPVGSWFR